MLIVKILQKIPLNYVASAAIISAACYAGCALASIPSNELDLYLRVYGPRHVAFKSAFLFFILLLIVNGSRRLKKLLFLLKELSPTDAEIIDKFEEYSFGRSSNILPLLFLAGYSAYRIFWWFPKYSYYREIGVRFITGLPLGLPFNIFTAFIWAIIYMLVGYQIWIWLRMIELTVLLPSLKLKLDLYDPTDAGGLSEVNSLSLASSLSLSAIGFLIPVAYDMTSVLGKLGIAVLAGYSLLIPLSYFVQSYFIHKAVVRAKIIRAEELRKEIERISSASDGLLMIKLHELDRLRAVKEWPFEPSTALELLMYMVMPPLVYLLQLIFAQLMG
jgi:hypothetical protein